MKIAIQAADLDHSRIDGTRVYILNVLRHLGKISPDDDFFIYHRKKFNPELEPPTLPNYNIKKMRCPLFWTQARLAYELGQTKPDCLWMPMHNIPLLRSQKIKTTVTIHDLAFKIFPDHFPKYDVFKLNLLTGWAVKRAQKIITISESSKKDILKYYPNVPEEKIRVIYHGFDGSVYSQARDELKENEVKNKFNVKGNYILYSGALQPRKNIEVLIRAFDIYKKDTRSDTKLVLVGEKAWLWQGILDMILRSPYTADIIAPGKLKFCDLGHLMRGAGVYVFPSLYEGFGITILEAMASKVPVVCSNNSSLPEVGGRAVHYFDSSSAEDLAHKIREVMEDDNLRDRLIARGQEQIKKFSWEKCAQETLEWIKA